MPTERTWQQVEATKSRAKRVALVEATLIWAGLDPFDAANLVRLAAAYRPKQAIPRATFLRWRKQPEAQRLMQTELAKLAEPHGLTRASVMEKIAKADDRMTTDSGYLGLLRIQAAIVGLPVEPSKADDGDTFGSVPTTGEEYTGPKEPKEFEGYDGPRALLAAESIWHEDAKEHPNGQQ